MRRSRYSGSGYLLNDNRCSDGGVEEADILGCMHCHATVPRKKFESTISTYAKCVACDGPLCPACGLDTQLYGHGNPMHERTMPHDQWVMTSLREIHRREQNAKVLGI